MSEKKEKLLDAVVSQMREEIEYEGRFREWDRYCADEISAEEITAAMEDEHGAEDRAVLEALFSPPTSSEISGLTNIAAQAMACQSTPDGDVVRLDSQKSPKRSMVRLMVPMAAAAAVLVCAGIVFMQLLPGKAPAATYSLSFEGGQDTFRSESTPSEGIPKLVPANEMEILLRPEKSTADKMDLALYYEKGGEISLWSAGYEKSASGVFRLHGTAEDLELPGPGEYTLYFVVGPKGIEKQLDDKMDSILLNDDRSSLPSGTQLLKQRVDIVGE